jgi:hypothetical protein
VGGKMEGRIIEKGTNRRRYRKKDRDLISITTNNRGIVFEGVNGSKRMNS